MQILRQGVNKSRGRGTGYGIWTGVKGVDGGNVREKRGHGKSNREKLERISIRADAYCHCERQRGNLLKYNAVPRSPPFTPSTLV